MHAGPQQEGCLRIGASSDTSATVNARSRHLPSIVPATRRGPRWECVRASSLEWTHSGADSPPGYWYAPVTGAWQGTMLGRCLLYALTVALVPELAWSTRTMLGRCLLYALTVALVPELACSTRTMLGRCLLYALTVALVPELAWSTRSAAML